MQKLTEMIDALVAEKTFSLDGVKAIEALRVSAEGLQKKLASAIEQSDSYLKGREEMTALAASRAAEVASWQTREAAISKRELAMTELEKRSAVSDARAETVKECFGLVFRNAVVSETAMRNVPLVQPSPGGGSYVSSGNESETRTRTQG